MPIEAYRKPKANSSPRSSSRSVKPKNKISKKQAKEMAEKIYLGFKEIVEKYGTSYMAMDYAVKFFEKGVMEKKDISTLKKLFAEKKVKEEDFNQLTKYLQILNKIIYGEGVDLKRMHEQPVVAAKMRHEMNTLMAGILNRVVASAIKTGTIDRWK